MISVNVSYFVSQLSDLNDLCSEPREVGQCSCALMVKLKHSQQGQGGTGKWRSADMQQVSNYTFSLIVL